MKNHSLANLYKENPLAACQKALRFTAKLDTGKRMDAINALLETHGVEAMRGDWQNGYWCDIVATYCNTGDTYALTVLCIRGETRFDRARFIVSSWGDWVEKNSVKYGIA